MNIKEFLKCFHRHSIDTHPACFAQGAVVDKRPDQTKPWFQEDGLRIGYLDIESDGLVANWSTMLTWCLKEKDGPTAYDRVTKEELFTGKGDKRIIESAINEMRKYSVIVTYYGTGFDLPFLRAKALHYDLDFPGYVFDGKKLEAEIYHFDLYYTVKSKLAIRGKGLDSACEYLNIKGKTDIDREAWRIAKYGDPAGLDEVLRHNVGDVEILEELHNRLVTFNKWSKRTI